MKIMKRKNEKLDKLTRHQWNGRDFHKKFEIKYIFQIFDTNFQLSTKFFLIYSNHS